MSGARVRVGGLAGSVSRCLALMLLMAACGLACAAGEADPPAALAAWAAAQEEHEPVARRAADLRAARTGSLPAMERLLLTGRFQEIALIDVRRPPFADWASRPAAGAITPAQVHGLTLANWVVRNPLIAGRMQPQLMGEARRDLQRDPLTHELVAVELGWHLGSFEPKDAAAGRRWFDQGLGLQAAAAAGDPWVRFCCLIDVATVAVNNGYADVAPALVERCEREAAGFPDPYAAGLTRSLRAFLQASPRVGDQDQAAAASNYALAAADFAKAEAPIMRAYALAGQADACQALAVGEPARLAEALRVLGECAVIYAQEGAICWRAQTLVQRGMVAMRMGDFAQTRADLRVAWPLVGELVDAPFQLQIGMLLVMELRREDLPVDRQEIIGLLERLIPLARKAGDDKGRRQLESLRSRYGQENVRKQ